MTGIEFLETTKPAVEHCFIGLGEYYSEKLPTFFDYVDKNGKITIGKHEARKITLKYEEFFALEEARAILAGSILQVAFSALKNYSTGSYISDECKNLGVKAKSSNLKMCVGRIVHNIPIGLMIYAGRIQYNHWEENELSNQLAKNVFRHLVSIYYNDLTFDMVYELGYPEPRPLSHHLVRHELNWMNYEDYYSDMVNMVTK